MWKEIVYSLLPKLTFTERDSKIGIWSALGINLRKFIMTHRPRSKLSREERREKRSKDNSQTQRQKTDRAGAETRWSTDYDRNEGDERFSRQR